MRMRSPARSRLRAPDWPDEPGRRSLAPNQGLHRPAPNPLAFVRAEGIAVAQVFAAHHVFVAQVDEPQVRVEAWRDIALVRQPEPPGDVRRGDRSDHGEVDVVIR